MLLRFKLTYSVHAQFRCLFSSAHLCSSRCHVPHLKPPGALRYLAWAQQAPGGVFAQHVHGFGGLPGFAGNPLMSHAHPGVRSGLRGVKTSLPERGAGRVSRLN